MSFVVGQKWSRQSTQQVAVKPPDVSHCNRFVAGDIIVLLVVSCPWCRLSWFGQYYRQRALDMTFCRILPSSDMRHSIFSSEIFRQS